jgi:transketolase
MPELSEKTMNSPVKPLSPRSLANALRALSMDAVQAANSGHPGMPLGMADVLTALVSGFMKFDSSAPNWPDRDRLVLSGGHGSMLLYSLLYLSGYPGIGIEDIKTFRKLGSHCAGHPEHGEIPGIETTTGPLGQGLSNAVGMALAERILNARYGDELVDHRTWCLCGDGDLMEGISHEAISIAGHLKLSKLTVLYDDNGISIDGPTSITDSTDTIKRFEAAGWATARVDGQDAGAVAAALKAALANDRPTLIACKTVIGFGAPKRAGTSKAHGEPLGAEEIAGVRKALDWPYEPFVVPDEIVAAWRAIGLGGKSARETWEKRKSAANPVLAKEFDERIAGTMPPEVWEGLQVLKKQTSWDKPAVATRRASQMVLEIVNTLWPATIGGSADLTPSNNTLTPTLKDIKTGDFSGRYMRWGVREHGMAGAMTGMALHGGVVPYGGAFFVFSDYCRPTMRLAALMGLRVIYVFTHDSIGVGEDGPTHQPVEHLAAARAIPGLRVFRPCDVVETAECWALALGDRHHPSMLALSRQNLMTARTKHTDENLCARGAYEIAAAENAKVTLLATGSEVELAFKARDLLAAEDISARIVSMPSWELFEEQDEKYRNEVLGPGTAKVGIEAALGFGWDRYIGEKGQFVGMHGFGASGPAKDVFQHFSITPEAVVAAAKKALQS